MPVAPHGRQERLAHLALVGAAFAFGTTFVVVKGAVDRVDPLTFLAARFLIAALVVAPFAWRPGRTIAPSITFAVSETPVARTFGGRLKDRGLLAHGVLAGSALLVGYAFQTVGLQRTSGSVSAFVTYLLVIMVALLHAVRRRRLPTAAVGAGVVTATIGLFLLSAGGGRGGWSVGAGEALTLAGAFGFAVHIMVLDEVAGRHDTLRLHTIQLAVLGSVCLVPAVLQPDFDLPLRVWAAVGYTAVLCSALAIFLQTWAQRHLGPTRTALLLMLEPVFAGMVGVVAGDQLGFRGAIGAGAILLGIALAEHRPSHSGPPTAH